MGGQGLCSVKGLIISSAQQMNGRDPFDFENNFLKERFLILCPVFVYYILVIHSLYCTCQSPGRTSSKYP
ncbi:hypothetical protein BDW66DRAFT_108344 [Aspergillus desertorum]